MKALPNCSDYIASIETPQLIKARALRNGRLVTKNGKILRYAGGFCIVFPYVLSSGRKVAVRCWTAEVPDAEQRCAQISKRLRESALPYFVGFDYIGEGIATSLGVFPVIIMDWVDAAPLKVYLRNHIDDTTRIKKLADEFYNMVGTLHKAGFSHGDLQHGNIMVSDSGQIILVDYDSMFVPGLEGLKDEIKGLPGYQHPGRRKMKDLSPKADYFSELIIYTSLLALSKHPALWTELEIEDTDTLVFTQTDLNAPQRSNTFLKLKADSELQDCVNAIEKALGLLSIDDLLPLEEAIIPEATRVVKSISGKWRRQATIVSEQEPEVDTEPIRNRWNTPRPQTPELEPVDVSSVTSKWR